MWNQKPYVDSQIRNFDYIAAHLTPDAAAADSGKVLTVGSDGKPEWAEAESGGTTANILMVTMSAKPDAEDTLILDKTYAEINAVWSNNGLVFLNAGEYGIYFVVSCLARGANEYAVSFTGFDAETSVSSLEFSCESESDYPEAVD